MNKSKEQYQQLQALLQQLSDYLEAFEGKARVYDATLRTLEANYPFEALTFKGCMEMVRAAGLRDSVSSDHQKLIEQALELSAGIFQATKTSRKPAKQVKRASKRKPDAAAVRRSRKGSA